jgi:hypothetical protein
LLFYSGTLNVSNMKRSKVVSLVLLGSLAGCWDTNPDDEQVVKEEVRTELSRTCTQDADSDVDCMPADGGHSEGTQQAYIHGTGGSNDAFLWYWLGTQNSRTVYVAPPAAPLYTPGPGSSSAFRSSPALSARGGFGGGAAAHGASRGGGS